MIKCHIVVSTEELGTFKLISDPKLTLYFAHVFGEKCASKKNPKFVCVQQKSVAVAKRKEKSKEPKEPKRKADKASLYMDDDGIEFRQNIGRGGRVSRMRIF